MKNIQDKIVDLKAAVVKNYEEQTKDLDTVLAYRGNNVEVAEYANDLKSKVEQFYVRAGRELQEIINNSHASELSDRLFYFGVQLNSASSKIAFKVNAFKAKVL